MSELRVNTDPKARAIRHRDAVDWLELCFKVVATVVALVGAYVAFMKYHSASQHELQVREHELRERMFERKLTVFDEAVRAASALVIAPSKDFDAQLDKFGVVKHGEAIMLGDSAVYHAMLRLYNDGVEKIYNQDKEADDTARATLEVDFEYLSDTCKREIKADLNYLTSYSSDGKNFGK